MMTPRLLKKQPGFYFRLAAQTLKHHFQINSASNRNTD